MMTGENNSCILLVTTRSIHSTSKVVCLHGKLYKQLQSTSFRSPPGRHHLHMGLLVTVFVL